MASMQDSTKSQYDPEYALNNETSDSNNSSESSDCDKSDDSDNDNSKIIKKSNSNIQSKAKQSKLLNNKSNIAMMSDNELSDEDNLTINKSSKKTSKKLIKSLNKKIKYISNEDSSGPISKKSAVKLNKKIVESDDESDEIDDLFEEWDEESDQEIYNKIKHVATNKKPQAKLKFNNKIKTFDVVKNIDKNKLLEFVGSNNATKGWLNCVYCAKYHPKTLHLSDLDYCAHCWGWLNYGQFNLNKGTYDGQGVHTWDEIKLFLNLTYELHPANCEAPDCIYKKIEELIHSKNLHPIFMNVLDIKEIIPIVKPSQISNRLSNINVDFKLSSITI